MYYLRLIKARSYTGRGLHATARSPLVTTEDEGVFQSALRSGYFVEAAPDERRPKRPEGTGTVEAIDTMNTTRLRTYARGLGMKQTWPNGTDAETIRADIRAFREESGNEDIVGQFTGEGSPTMAGLQEER